MVSQAPGYIEYKTGNKGNGENMTKKLEDLFITGKYTIKNAMKHMDKGSRKILFLTDKKRKLIGTITDGDIRRWILTDGDLGAKVDKIYNDNPVYVDRYTSKRRIRKIMLEAGVNSLPIVDENKRIVNLLFWSDVIKDEAGMPSKAQALKIPLVVMAGGQGSRLDPFTKILPKALIPVGDKPVIELIIDNFREHITDAIYFIIGYKGEMIKSYFDNSGAEYKVKYIYEKDRALGTVGGLKLLPRTISNTFFLSNCDTIIKARYDDIYSFHKKNGYDLTIICSMQHFVVPYGVVDINSGGELKKIEEKPEYDFLVNTGMYLVDKKTLRYIPRDRTFHITDFIKKLKRKKCKIGVYPVSEKSWLDVGQWEAYKETTKNFQGKL